MKGVGGGGGGLGCGGGGGEFFEGGQGFPAHRPRTGRLHGHAGHAHQRNGFAERVRTTRSLYKTYVGHTNGTSVRAVYSPPSYPSLGKRKGGDFWGRHRQSVFHHGFHGQSSRHRNSSRLAFERHARGRRVQQRPRKVFGRRAL